MNFASWTFVLLFLPVTLAAFHLIPAADGAGRRVQFLILMSAVFYAWSGVANALVLAASLALNLAAGLLLTRDMPNRARGFVFWAAVAANLGLLVGFKIAALDAPGPDGFRAAESILIPLALSFVTFQQIGFVTACYRRQVRRFAARDYLFFALFFPQLIMGPILRFQDISPQLAREHALAPDREDLAAGLAIFTFGLAEKVLLADQIAPGVNAVFAQAEFGPVTAAEAWYAIAAFQMQIYFDFAGYADMAIGLGRMFGTRLPINFDRPQFATDRFEFWRRFHITFVVFMRSHVFLPLIRRWRWPPAAALAMTGMLSGLWHGLGWTFIVWGLVQTAIMLAVHQRRKWRRAAPTAPVAIAGAILLTFLASTLIGVLFRAPTLEAAQTIYGSLFGWGLPVSQTTLLGPSAMVMLPLCVLVAWGLTNSAQLFRRFWNAIDPRSDGKPPPLHPLEARAGFSMSVPWAMVIALLLVLSLAMAGEASRFIYVQF